MYYKWFKFVVKYYYSSFNSYKFNKLNNHKLWVIYIYIWKNFINKSRYGILPDPHGKMTWVVDDFFEKVTRFLGKS